MADHALQFSEMIENITKEEHQWLEMYLAKPDEETEDMDKWWEERPELDRDLEPDMWPGCSYELRESDEKDSASWWIYADENGYPEIVASVVRQFLHKFRPDNYFTLTWAETCSKPRLSAFCGGGMFVTAKLEKFYNPWSEFDKEREKLKGKN